MEEYNEIWDEFRWEEFMKEQDKMADRYMELLYRFQDRPDREEIIAQEMGWSWLVNREDEQQEETDEGEGWKVRSGIHDEDDDERFDVARFKALPVYQKVNAFAIRSLKFIEELPEDKRVDSSVVDFVSNATIAAAKIAGGSRIGYDIEELGGNIAYCKRGLNAANLSLVALREMRDKRIIANVIYLDLAKSLTEVRNIIAAHVLELREKFRRGM